MAIETEKANIRNVLDGISVSTLRILSVQKLLQCIFAFFMNINNQIAAPILCYYLPCFSSLKQYHLNLLHVRFVHCALYG